MDKFTALNHPDVNAFDVKRRGKIITVVTHRKAGETNGEYNYRHEKNKAFAKRFEKQQSQG